MPRCNNNSKKGQSKCNGIRAGLFFGGSLIMAGSAFLLSRLGYLGDLTPSMLWPVLLIWAGLLKLTNRSFGSGILFIAAGATLQAHYLGKLHLEWSVIWPILLIVAGVSIFLSSVFKRRRKPKEATSSDSFLDISVTLGGREEIIDAVEFEGGELSCVMSGLELDLRNARMKGNESVLNMRVIMGGVEMRVPDDWTVVLKGSPVMGGFENKTRPSVDPDNGGYKLIVNSTVVMGGVEVSN